jgi:hypothetical protein
MTAGQEPITDAGEMAMSGPSERLKPSVDDVVLGVERDEARVIAIVKGALSDVETWLEGGGWRELEELAAAGCSGPPRWSDPATQQRIRDRFSEILKDVIRTARDSSERPSFIGSTTIALGVIEDLTRHLDDGALLSPSTPAELLQLLVAQAWRRTASKDQALEVFLRSNEAQRLQGEALEQIIGTVNSVASGLDDEEREILIYSISEYDNIHGVQRVSDRMNGLGREAVQETIRSLGLKMRRHRA